MRHELKCWPEYFKAIRSGSKNFEIRRDDRGYEVDDELELSLWDPDAAEGDEYGHEVLVAVVERVWAGVPGLEEGYVVMAIRVTQHRME